MQIELIIDIFDQELERNVIKFLNNGQNIKKEKITQNETFSYCSSKEVKHNYYGYKYTISYNDENKMVFDLKNVPARLKSYYYQWQENKIVPMDSAVEGIKRNFRIVFKRQMLRR